jgi:predicted nucleotidyltransferase
MYGMATAMHIDRAGLSALCERRHVRSLSLLGSAVHDYLDPNVDVHVLVEFEPGCVPGFFALHDFEMELSPLFGGSKVDLVTLRSLGPRLRDRVLAEARLEYAAGGMEAHDATS